MLTDIIKIILIPFIGTFIGSACVFFIGKTRNALLEKSMNGFAAGVMIASAVWSLILPSIELASDGFLPSFLAAAIGLWLGIIFFFSLDKFLVKINSIAPTADQNGNLLTLLAIIIHNFPEGMALGVMCAAYLTGEPLVSLSGILALALGIGVQNLPEGAIISLPLYIDGKSRPYAFFIGIVSAITETLGSILMILSAPLVIPILPYMMCFAAGAMIYVVISELCPEISEGRYTDIATLMFGVGFSLMMVLDVALG